MIELAIIGGIIWILARSASALRRQRLDRQAERERERIREEQQRIQKEQAAQREEQRRMVAEQIAAARERAELRQEQERQRREQERQEKEQARQAAILARHEKRLAELTHKIQQAEADIMNEQTRIDYYTSQLIALDNKIARLDRDIEYNQLAGAVDKENEARAERDKLRDKAFRLQERVWASEKRMEKARYIAESARAERGAA